MKRYLAFAFGAALTFSMAPQLGAAPQFGRNTSRDRVCLYKDAQYVGSEQCYNAGDEIRSLGGGKDQVSSIRIFGRARVTVYDQTDFKGRTAEFDSNVPDLHNRAASGGHTWNDRIESLRVTSDFASVPSGNSAPPVYGRNDPYPRDNRNANVNEGVCVYERRNYEGRSQCWDGGVTLSDLDRNGNWSNRIASIRVLGGARAVVYRNAGFRGESMVIDRSIPDLAQLPGRSFRNWNRQISSMQVEAGRGFPGRGRGRDRGFARERQ